MPVTSLRIADLDPLFASVSYEEATAIANLGAVCWTHFKDRLFAHWTATADAEEADRADQYREEGRKAATAEVLESLKGRLAAADAMEGELSVARAAVEKLQGVVAAEAAKRAEALVESARREFEVAKREEVIAYKEKLAAVAAQADMLVLLKANNDALAEKVAALEATRDELLSQTTKSSTAIGKAGEATLMDMLERIVPKLPYASVKDMTAVSHAADFHLSVMMPSGTKVKILVDSKKYKRRINTSEIEKLYSDVDGDDEAHAGLLVSQESPICTMSQFEVSRTPKQKPVMFISFDGVGTEYRQDMLLWAVRALVEVCGAIDDDDKDHMLKDIEEFLSELDGSVKDIDGAMRTMTKSIEALKEARNGIVRKMVKFRSGAAGDDAVDAAVALVEGCGHMLKSGRRCGKKVSGAGEALCKAHAAKDEN